MNIFKYSKNNFDFKISFYDHSFVGENENLKICETFNKILNSKFSVYAGRDLDVILIRLIGDIAKELENFDKIEIEVIRNNYFGFSEKFSIIEGMPVYDFEKE